MTPRDNTRWRSRSPRSRRHAPGWGSSSPGWCTPHSPGLWWSSHTVRFVDKVDIQVLVLLHLKTVEVVPCCDGVAHLCERGERTGPRRQVSQTMDHLPILVEETLQRLPRHEVVHVAQPQRQRGLPRRRESHGQISVVLLAESVHGGRRSGASQRHVRYRFAEAGQHLDLDDVPLHRLHESPDVLTCPKFWRQLAENKVPVVHATAWHLHEVLELLLKSETVAPP
mmetsp:Transcript_70976/g.114474  ORF Transcript_70976/g.114474 Transcript_70976/m.114474 type:complete len:225 (+) Transcript_70976:731-1405(+)